MAKWRQEYPDVELTIDRDCNGSITRMEYTINDKGEDRKNIIEFIEMLSLLCQDPVEAKRIMESTLPAKERS